VHIVYMKVTRTVLAVFAGFGLIGKLALPCRRGRTVACERDRRAHFLRQTHADWTITFKSDIVERADSCAGGRCAEIGWKLMRQSFGS
jgi:hypothetical protein